MNGSVVPMYISKPKTDEELYALFVKGLPYKPIYSPYSHDYRRKGWNVTVDGWETNLNAAKVIKFYTLAKAYYPDWELKIIKYLPSC